MKADRRPLGRLQRQCRRAFIALGIALTTRELASWCYPRALMRGEKLPRWRIGNMARAAKSIGARPGEQVGRQRIWRLKMRGGADMGTDAITPNSSMIAMRGGGDGVRQCCASKDPAAAAGCRAPISATPGGTFHFCEDAPLHLPSPMRRRTPQ